MLVSVTLTFDHLVNVQANASMNAMRLKASLAFRFVSAHIWSAIILPHAVFAQIQIGGTFSTQPHCMMIHTTEYIFSTN